MNMDLLMRRLDGPHFLSPHPGPLPQERGKHAQFPEFSRPLVWNCFMGTRVGGYDSALRRSRITLSPCLSIFASAQMSGTSSVSRRAWPRTNKPPAASRDGRFELSSNCCAQEVERRPTFFSP